jgi:hypothetical protein
MAANAANNRNVNVPMAPDAGPLWDWLTATAPLDAPLLAEERDDVAAEVWRREQVPPWSYRSRTVERG